MDSSQVGSQHSLIPHRSSSRVDPTPPSLSSPPLSLSTPPLPLSSPPLSPSSPGPSNHLRNFVQSNLGNFPLLARVTRSSDGNNNNSRSTNNNRSSNNNDDDVVDEDIYYNTLLHHRIQKGSLLVFHAPTRQVKILARSASTGRCYSIPSTYQGTFHILRNAFNSLEEFLAWKDVNNSDIYKEFMTPKTEKLVIISPDPEYGHLLEAGDVIKVKPIPPSQSVAQSQRGVDGDDDVTANGNQNPRNNCSTFSQFYRSQNKVQLEIFDPTSRRSRDIEVPFELKATMEEVVDVETDRLVWTVGKLTPLAQRQRIWVKLIQGGTDHPTHEEDLPLEDPLELVQVIAEPSVWVSDQNPDAPLFHLPLRMDVCLKIVKQLQREKSPLLSENKILASLLDRCVEHLPLEVFQDILRQRYIVDDTLEPKPVASNNTKSRSALVKPRPPHEIYRQISPPQLIYRQVSINHRPRLDTITAPKLQRSTTNANKLRQPHPVRSQSIFTRLLMNSSKTEPPLMEFPQVSKYKVAQRTSSAPKRPEPARLVSASKRHTKVTHPAVALTPATPKVKETEYNFWREYETISGVFVEDEQSRNYVASAIVGRPDDAEAIDPYTRVSHPDRVNLRTPRSTGSDEVFQGNSTTTVHKRAEIPLVKNGPNKAILRGDISDLYSIPIKSRGGNGTSDYEMAVPGKLPPNTRSDLRSDRSTDGSHGTGNNRQSVGAGASGYGGNQTGSLMEISTSGSDVDLIKKSRTRKGKTPTYPGIPTAVARPEGSDFTGGRAVTSQGLGSSVQVLHPTEASGITIGPYQNINGWKDGKPRKNAIRHITVIKTSSTENDDDGLNPDPEIDEIVRSKEFLKRSLSENPNSKSTQIDTDAFLDISLKPRNAAVEDVASETNERTDLPYELTHLMEELNLPRDGNLYTFSTGMFTELIQDFGLPDSVIKECVSQKIDGKKFSMMSNSDLDKVGLRHPVMEFLKNKTRKPKLILNDESIISD